MQENNPVPTPVVTPPIVVEQPKQSNFLIILLSILLLLSVLIAGFFAYQTQKLVAELTLLRTEPTSIVTPEPTTEPIATDSSEVDPTANWKTYINEKYEFEIKYPQDSTIEIKNEPWGNIIFQYYIYPTANDNKKYDLPAFIVWIEKTELSITDYVKKYGRSETNLYPSFPYKESDLLSCNINNIDAYCIKELIENKEQNTHFFVKDNEYLIELINRNIDKDFFDQILSTFKFTN